MNRIHLVSFALRKSVIVVEHKSKVQYCIREGVAEERIDEGS
jgi:hypothetical protein